MSCSKTKAHLTDLIFDPDHASAQARKHVAACPDCASELQALEAIMKVLEEWQAPEPDAFFDAKLRARLHREMESAPAGFFSRLRSRIAYGSRFSLRQWAAGALAAMLVAGVGSYALVNHEESSTGPQISATLRDLQAFNSDQQLYQQLNALDAPADNGSSASN